MKFYIVEKDGNNETTSIAPMWFVLFLLFCLIVPATPLIMEILK